MTVESGKRKNATFRWACSKRLPNALSTLTHNSRRWVTWAADRDAQSRARGHTHARALRTPGSRLEPHHLALPADPHSL